MIKIHNKLWYVIDTTRDTLAYMCQYEETKDGQPLANITKMQDTGRSWARQREYEKVVEGVEGIVENKPVAGFYIADSVSRWSTSNKLFRVKDPRGFTVEVPTGNIAVLLHHCTVVNGVVQQECVWGRDGNNHILLPVNSQPYIETLDKMDIVENKLIALNALKKGDVVKLFEDETEYTYYGKVKLKWKLIPEKRTRNYSFNNPWTTAILDPIEVQDDKWINVFGWKYSSEGREYFDTKSNPKIVEIVRNIGVDVNSISFSYPPDRVRNKVHKCHYDYNYQFSYQYEIIGIEEK